MGPSNNSRRRRPVARRRRRPRRIARLPRQRGPENRVGLLRRDRPLPAGRPRMSAGSTSGAPVPAAGPGRHRDRRARPPDSDDAATMSAVVRPSRSRRRAGRRSPLPTTGRRRVAQPVGLVRRVVARRHRLHEGDRLRRRRQSAEHGPMTEASPPTRHVTTTRIVAVRGGALEFRDDRVVGEEPLEIRAAGPGQDPVAVAVTMRTPGLRGRARDRLPADRGPDRRPGGHRGSTSGDPAAMNQPDDQVTVRLARPFDASRRRRAALRRDGVVRDLRQGLARRGRRPLRPDPGRARSSTAA